MKESVVHVG